MEQAKCLICEGQAVFTTDDGNFCKECMGLHILEKMLVQQTAVAGRR